MVSYSRLAAREADIVGFVPQFNAAGRPIVRQTTEGALAEGRARADRGGRAVRSLELNVFVAIAGLVRSGSGPLPSAVAVGIRPLPSSGHRTSCTTRPRLQEILERRRELFGISYYSIPQPAMESMAPLIEDLAGR